MANTYSQIYVQIVFAVNGRETLIRSEYRETLQKFIAGVIANKDQKLLAIYSMPDHTHLLIGLKPNKLISELAKEIKSYSSKHINDNNWFEERFSWQEGYGVFSYSRNDLDRVVKYILNQEEHHAKTKMSFREEYLSMLRTHQIPFEEKYIFV